MKPRDSVLRLREFELVEQRRKLQDMQMMINDFLRMAADLEQQIEAEHMRSGIRDRSHFAYSSFAKAAALRRDNLMTSVDDLKVKYETAKRNLENAEEDVKRMSSPENMVEERSSLGRRPNARLRGRMRPGRLGAAASGA